MVLRGGFEEWAGGRDAARSGGAVGGSRTTGRGRYRRRGAAGDGGKSGGSVFTVGWYFGGGLGEKEWRPGRGMSHPKNLKYINCCLIGIFRNDFKSLEEKI